MKKIKKKPVNKKITILLIAINLALILFHLQVFNRFFYFTVHLKLWNHENLKLSTYYQISKEEFLAKTRRLMNFKIPDQDLPEYKVTISLQHINQLNSSLPQSGLSYKPATLLKDDEKIPVEIRYRGDNSFHWFHEKKSYKIKLPQDKRIDGQNIIQLTDTKSPHYFVEYSGNLLAEKLGLIHSQEKFVKLFVNNKYQGIYLQLEYMNEKAFFETKNKTFGDLYTGENFAEKDKIRGLSDNVYINPYAWEKKTENELGQNTQDQHLKQLIRTTQEVLLGKVDPQELTEYFDSEYIKKFLAWQTISQSSNMNNTHNQIMYFDYTMGKFYPIPWDSYPFWKNYESLNVASNDLLKALFKNPVLVHEKNKIARKEVTDNQIIKKIQESIKEEKKKMIESIYKDHFKATLPNVRRIINNKEYEKYFNTFINSIGKYKTTIKTLKDPVVTFKTQKLTPSIMRIKITVSGSAAVKIDQLVTNPNCQFTQPTLYADLNLNETYDNEDLIFKKENLLYPGLEESKETGHLVSYPLHPSPLTYTFFSNQSCDIEKIKFINDIDGTNFEISESEGDEQVSSLFSVHPWKTKQETDKKYKEIIAQIKKDNLRFIFQGKNIIIPKGIHYIKKDIIIPKESTLIINPGANLKISKQISILSYGKVIAKGKPNQTINISSLNTDSFGSFAVSGKEANNSEFDYFNITNGSETFLNNTYFSGMFSAYHIPNIFIDHSSFSSSKSDDGINIKYSSIKINNSHFETNEADAIDLDFCQGEVSQNIFTKNGNDSIDISGSSVTINNNYINESGDKCISVGENSKPLIKNNVLSNCNVGIESKDLSEPTIENNVFFKNNTALNAYQKKEFFGPSKITVLNSIFIDNEKNKTLENTFEGEKMENDTSEITILNSLFDKINKNDDINNKKNIKDKNLYKIAKEYDWSIPINHFEENKGGRVGLYDPKLTPKEIP